MIAGDKARGGGSNGKETKPGEPRQAGNGVCPRMALGVMKHERPDVAVNGSGNCKGKKWDGVGRRRRWQPKKNRFFTVDKTFLSFLPCLTLKMAKRHTG